MDRNEAIKEIRAALKKRSGKTWSVTGGRGTAWGWITIDAPPARRNWRDISTKTSEPPRPGAVYCGMHGVTPRHAIRDGSITSPDDDPWATQAMRKGIGAYFDWEVEDPDYTYGHTGPADRAELAELLGLEYVHHQGQSIPDGAEYRLEYVARARGVNPTVLGEQYWD